MNWLLGVSVGLWLDWQTNTTLNLLLGIQGWGS